MAKRLFALTISFMLLAMPTPVLATELSVIPTAVPSDNTSVDTLAFTSDAHNENDASAERVSKWIPLVATAENDLIDMFSTCGDNGTTHYDKARYWSEANSFLSQITSSSEYIKNNGVLIAGNHEWDTGKISSSSSSNVYNVDYKVDDKAEVNDTDYEIYNFGVTADRDNGFTDGDIAYLDKYLSGASGNKPIFILSHFPLHNEGSRYNYNQKGKDVIETINKYAEGKTIVFLWGHTHTDSKSTEHNYGVIRNPGDSINSSTINFNYCAAGCMSDSEYSSGSGGVKEKGLIARINTSTHATTLQYYSENGSCLSSGSAKPGISETVTGVTIAGPNQVMVGNTIQLTAAVTGTSKDTSVTWSELTGNATIDAKGKVTGVAAGKAIAKATSNKDATKFCEYEITVTAPPAVVHVEEVELDKSELNLIIGSTETLVATVKPDDAENKNVTWSSSNNAIATVNSSGKITAKGVGEATITVKTDDGNKTAKCKVTVKPKNTSNITISNIGDMEYTGEIIKPAVVLTDGDSVLVEGTDYTVKSTDAGDTVDNVNVSQGIKTGSLTIKLKGNYDGELQKTFKIVPKRIDSSEIRVEVPDQIYTGIDVIPNVNVKYIKSNSEIILENSKDFRITKIENNDKPGNADDVYAPKVTIEGIGNYSGIRTVKFTIIYQEKIDINDCNVVLVKADGSSLTSLEYNGKDRKNEVNVAVYIDKQQIESELYSVDYDDCKTIGIHVVTITGVGMLEGSCERTFKILPRKVSGLSLTAGKKSIKVKWKKDSAVTGYQIVYSTSNTFKSYKRVTITKKSTVSKTIKSLKKSKKYYVKIRAYKTVNGVKYYGAYSNSKYKKTK